MYDTDGRLRQEKEPAAVLLSAVSAAAFLLSGWQTAPFAVSAQITSYGSSRRRSPDSQNHVYNLHIPSISSADLNSGNSPKRYPDLKKRKPWRTFKKKRFTDKTIRRFCMAALIAEGIALGLQGRFPFPTVEVREGSEIVIYQLPAEYEETETGKAEEHKKARKTKEPDKERIYGVKIRLKDGVVDFYRREELKKTEG